MNSKCKIVKVSFSYTEKDEVKYSAGHIQLNPNQQTLLTMVLHALRGVVNNCAFDFLRMNYPEFSLWIYREGFGAHFDYLVRVIIHK